MPVVKTARALIDVLDANFNITGHEIEYHYTFEGDGAEMFTPKVQRDLVTPAQIAVFRTSSSDALTAAHQNLNAKIAALQIEVSSANAARDKALTALRAIAAADENYDVTVRPSITAALA